MTSAIWIETRRHGLPLPPSAPAQEGWPLSVRLGLSRPIWRRYITSLSREASADWDHHDRRAERNEAEVKRHMRWRKVTKMGRKTVKIKPWEEGVGGKDRQHKLIYMQIHPPKKRSGEKKRPKQQRMSSLRLMYRNKWDARCHGN